MLNISHMHSCLAKKIKDFLHGANSHLPPLEEVDLRQFEDEVIDTPLEESVQPELLLDVALDEDVGGDEEDESETPSTLGPSSPFEHYFCQARSIHQIHKGN